jgi:integration host factor subunit beta
VVQLNKSDLVLKIVSLNPNIYQKDVIKIVDVFFGTISKALSRNDRVELRGFGAFDVKNREARIARNPKNGSIVAVPSKKKPFFRMGKGMKERLNK